MTSRARKLHFSTHAELKNVIGQDLINDDNIAIIELVKNGIDAGASKVSLTFSPSTEATNRTTKGAIILIKDDGAGMSVDDIQGKWLNIAYSEKKDAKNEGRVLAGNKGVGRFACDRLGAKLDMYTRKKGGPLIHLSVDWTAFENKKNIEDTIQKVSVYQSEITPAEMRDSIGVALRGNGTVLAISGIRQPWNRDQLLQLRQNLERFVNPIAVFDRNTVEITMAAPAEIGADRDAEDYEKVNGVVSNQVFDKLKFKTTYIEASLNKTGKLLTTELFHEGSRIYRLVEERTDFLPLKGVAITLHYMNSYKKAYFKRQTGRHLVDFGSIFLFINGYRVSPYGDRDNDWLQLDTRKAQGTGRFLGGRELVGHIDVHDRATKLRIVSNREGVIRDAAYTKLTSRDGIFFAALTRLERFVIGGLNWDTVSTHIRQRLQAGELPGEGDMPRSEIYEESTDKKRRRIAMDVLRIVGASPTTTRELDIDADVLDTLARERAEDVKGILDRFESFDQDTVGQDMRLALNRIKKEFDQQKEKLTKTQQEASRKSRQVERLKNVARGISKKNTDLERRIETQETELMFARVSSSSDKEQLMLLHHQSGIYATSGKNFLEKALSLFRHGDTERAAENVEKALNVTNKILTVTNFATKANFRLKTGFLTSDIIQFIQEYLTNVIKETVAQNTKLSVRNESNEPFITRFKPIELAIVFDNLVSNSERADARNFEITIQRPSDNELVIRAIDDGPGLSIGIVPPDRVFERGVTTTNGSGLGLYHVRDTVKQMGGTVNLIDREEPGFGVEIRLIK